MNTLSFRPYGNDDLDACTELSKQAWPVVFKFADEKNASPFIKAYVLNNLNTANYAEVCCDGDKIVGFLFANLKKYRGTTIEKSGNRKLFFDYLAGKYGKVRKRFRLLFAQMWATAKAEHICKNFDGEILLFVVDAAYRGHGIGKTLMGHFLEYAKQNKLKNVFLATDPLCNWVFYEKIGFVKFGEYYDNSLSILMGQHANSYIYYKQLEGV